MSSMPRWYAQLAWRRPAVPVVGFVTGLVDRATIAEGAGLYVFSNDDQALTRNNVLYVGKADGRNQHLRSRLSVYFRRLGRLGGKPSRHAGLEALFALYKERPNALYVRWAGCVVARELEGTLIELFDPPCNHKDEHRFGYADDELIPSEYLYEV